MTTTILQRKNKGGSDFEYVRVGQALDPETLLEGELPSYETFAKRVLGISQLML